MATLRAPFWGVCVLMTRLALSFAYTGCWCLTERLFLNGMCQTRFTLPLTLVMARWSTWEISCAPRQTPYRVTAWVSTRNSCRRSHLTASTSQC